jgi:unsaturated rhamnogalacturonyl hydrolase
MGCACSTAFKFSFNWLDFLADITSQFKLMFDNTLQNATAPNNTGLMYRPSFFRPLSFLLGMLNTSRIDGYDFSHTAVWASPDRGHSPEVWIRALGSHNNLSSSQKRGLLFP